MREAASTRDFKRSCRGANGAAWDSNVPFLVCRNIAPHNTKNPNPISESGLVMEHKGVEPLASTMPLWRATNCANAPQQFDIIADSAQPVKRCGV